MRYRKKYKLSAITSANVNDESAKLPEIFEDINKNAALCNTQPLPISRIIKIVQRLQDFQNEFKEFFNEFSMNVEDLENRCEEFLQTIPNDYKSTLKNQNPENVSDLIDDIFKVLSVEFKNQDGEANIDLKLSMPVPEKESHPVNPAPPKQYMIEYDEQGKEILTDPQENQNNEDIL